MTVYLGTKTFFYLLDIRIKMFVIINRYIYICRIVLIVSKCLLGSNGRTLCILLENCAVVRHRRSKHMALTARSFVKINQQVSIPVKKRNYNKIK